MSCPLCWLAARTYWQRMRLRWLLWHHRAWCRLGLHWWSAGYTGNSWCVRGCGTWRGEVA